MTDVASLAADERAALYRGRARQLRRKAKNLSGQSRANFLILAEEWERLAKAVEIRYPVPMESGGDETGPEFLQATESVSPCG